MIRKSTLADIDAIKELMKLCFGSRDEFKPCKNIVDRYYLYFKDDKLIAMSGLMYNDEYEALEIDWTCTHPDYRHKGYMQDLFIQMLSNVKRPVYCSCWRLSDRELPNLYTLMKMFSFEKVIESRLHLKTPYNCKRMDYCVYCTGENCECFEDLYVRKVVE